VAEAGRRPRPPASVLGFGPMNRSELMAITRGPFATLPTAFDADFRLDLPTMARMTEWWIGQGLTSGHAVLKVAAAMGEGPDLTDDEWPALLEAVARAAAGRATIFCALKTKATLQTIEDAKRAADLGAVGLQIDLPIFHHPTQDDMVRYFTDISEAIGIGVLVYNTWWFADGSFGDRWMRPETVRRLAETTEHVVGIKWSAPPGEDFEAMAGFADVISVIDNSGDYVRAAQLGGAGFIGEPIVTVPAIDLELWELLQAKRWADAQALMERIHLPFWEFVGRTKLRSGGYRVAKGTLKLLGMPMGDPRPPTLPLQPDEMAELRELLVGFGWLSPQPGRPVVVPAPGM
jgi:4-hydroxy-tetrahydrodipicolinate synthase